MLYPTECCWASSVVGAELDFAIVTDFSDIDALSLPRRLQRKIGCGRGRYAMDKLGVGSAGLPPPCGPRSSSVGQVKKGRTAST